MITWKLITVFTICSHSLSTTGGVKAINIRRPSVQCLRYVATVTKKSPNKTLNKTPDNHAFTLSLKTNENTRL